MSLNWKEINLVLSELELPGMQIQKALQSAYDVMALRLYGRGKTHLLLISLSPGACRLHETFRGFPKTDKPLRFAEFLNSRIVNGWIEEAVQLGDNRIIRLLVRQGENHYRLYIRLWSNAANVVVTAPDGAVLDAMKRLPKRGEVSGGRYAPEEEFGSGPVPECPAGMDAAGADSGTYREKKRVYEVREFETPGTFNEKLDAWYTEHGGGLSLEKLREQVKKKFDGSIARLSASLEKLRVKEADYAASERLKEYGDIILANLGVIKSGDTWLEAENFYREGIIRIRLPPLKNPSAMAEYYYEEYRKAKNGLEDIQAEIEEGARSLKRLEEEYAKLLAETNPLHLNRLMQGKGQKSGASPQTLNADRRRPGLSFRTGGRPGGDWLIIVGRDAAENDALLRRHVKGNDLWLHARDFPGSYVFIKQKPGKSVPLDILLDAGNLALFYSKGRNNGEGDLFYTQVKYLRRAKNGPKGLVIPTQEKNIHVKIEDARLKELEDCRIGKQER
ncbi:MAG: NFACT RNA binding domain-containing protein [Treponema sp.]|jgi:predicted ribosome quality control (RQC) complex YloA/Tae2 family protein|nr:NFACT RNA binding domain-containing protein [Treponema sp.]